MGITHLLASALAVEVTERCNLTDTDTGSAATSTRDAYLEDGSDRKFQGHSNVAVPLYHLWAATPYCFEADMQHRLLSGEIARFLMSTSPLWWGDAQKEGIVLKRHSA